MKVLFCGLKYDYGQVQRGLSFEYQNFYQVLASMAAVKAELFAVDEKISELGKEAANALLIRAVQETKPDLLFCFLFTDEIEKETIRFITKNTTTKTFNWFADDHWRLPIYSRFWAPLFTLTGTTDSQAPAKYASFGIKNVIKTQWAANHTIYKPHGFQSDNNFHINSDVSFVGKNYGKRQIYLEFLKKSGLAVQAFGSGWPSAWISHGQMVDVFSFSKINLNFTESYFSWSKQLAKLVVKKQDNRYVPNFYHPISNLQSLFGARRRQIKGRTFEVPACGGFLLTGDADNLGDYYRDGREIVIFKDKFDLAEKCKYYLEHENERKTIAQAGYMRTVKEHTYQRRFVEIFKALGLM